MIHSNFKIISISISQDFYLSCNNIKAIKLPHTSIFHTCTKYIKINVEFFCKILLSKEIFYYIFRFKNIFTEPSFKLKFYKIYKILSVPSLSLLQKYILIKHLFWTTTSCSFLSTLSYEQSLPSPSTSYIFIFSNDIITSSLAIVRCWSIKIIQCTSFAIFFYDFCKIKLLHYNI